VITQAPLKVVVGALHPPHERHSSLGKLPQDRLDLAVWIRAQSAVEYSIERRHWNPGNAPGEIRAGLDDAE